MSKTFSPLGTPANRSHHQSSVRYIKRSFWVTAHSLLKEIYNSLSWINFSCFMNFAIHTSSCHQLLFGFLAKGNLPRVLRQSRRSLMIGISFCVLWILLCIIKKKKQIERYACRYLCLYLIDFAIYIYLQMEINLYFCYGIFFQIFLFVFYKFRYTYFYFIHLGICFKTIF